MDEQDRRAAFISSYRQHRRGWTHSNIGGASTNSFNSTTSSIWSCNNVSLNSDLSMEGISENFPDVDTVTMVTKPTDVDRRCVTVVVDPPETCRSYLTSSSSITSSIPFGSEVLTSSQDNGPSSEISTPENNNLKTFPATLKSGLKLVPRKSSDDDDVDVTLQRSARSRKKLSPRRLTPRRNATNTPQSAVTYFSSPYPSSVTSSAGHCSTCESSSDDDKLHFAKTRISDDVLNHNAINERKNEENVDIGIMITVQENDVVASGASLIDDVKGGRFPAFRKESKSFKLFPPTQAENNLTINVSGKIYEVESETLSRYPNTTLGNPLKRSRYYDKTRREYFLDRHRDTFQVVLDFYYNGGVLCRPDDIPIDIFLNELKFYSLDRETLEHFLREEGILHVEVKKELPKGKLKRFIWGLFEDHEGSIPALIVTIISAIVIVISVIVFCLETLDGFESLSNDLSQHFAVALNICQNSLSEADLTTSVFEPNQRLKRSYSGLNINVFDGRNILFVPVLNLYPLSYLTFNLQKLLKSCQNDAITLQNEYVFARCLIELRDEEKKLPVIFSKINISAPKTNDFSQTESSKQPKALSTISFNEFQTFSERTKTVIEETSKTASLIQNHEIPTSQVVSNSSSKAELLSKKQLFFFAHQACTVLDQFSTKTPYEWFVLEGVMGSRAGILFLTETTCIFWFVTELALRFFSAPNKKKFAKSFLNAIDFLAILPYFITLIVTTIETKTHVRPQTATILRTIRLVRMLRILKLSRYSRGFRILGLTLVRSTRVLFLLVCFQVVLAVLFSSIAYFVEYDEPNTKFHSIPETFWWALITMTTVGYGDVYPITIWGKLAGACCAIMGILCISFPVPVVVSNFNYLYHLDKDKFKLAPEDLMEEEEEDRGENFEKFQENLFEEMRRSVSELTEEKTNRNPAELWNIARKSYRKVSLANIDARLEKSPSRSMSLAVAAPIKQNTMLTIQGQRRENRGTSV